MREAYNTERERVRERELELKRERERHRERKRKRERETIPDADLESGERDTKPIFCIIYNIYT
jgi:hypothetical protein